MEPDRATTLYRKLYARLLCLYPKAHRKRFAEGMEQMFNDLLRERGGARKGLFRFVVWMFAETCTAIVRENVTNVMRCGMEPESALLLKRVKYAAIMVGALMVVGIGTLMVISRGKGEDITGIVSPALLVTFLSSVVAIVAAFFQRRVQKAMDTRGNREVMS